MAGIKKIVLDRNFQAFVVLLCFIFLLATNIDSFVRSGVVFLLGYLFGFGHSCIKKK